MLKVLIDDPAARRLVLRADPWGVVEIGRRVLATAIAVGAMGFAIAVAVTDGAEQLLWALPVALMIAWLAISAPRAETAEIGIDGGSRTLWLRRRGDYCWRSSRREIALGGDVQVRLRGGLVAPGGIDRPEIGLELWLAHADPTAASRFAVAGVDRRSDVRQLADAIARRLDLRVTTELDDLYELRIALGETGDAPPPVARIGGGYRDGAVEPALDLSRLPSFEEPTIAPLPLPRESSTELREHLRSEGGVLTVTMPPRPPWKVPRAVRWLFGLTLFCGALGVMIGVSLEDLLSGLLIGLSIVPIVVLGILVATLIGIAIGISVIAPVVLLRGLLGGFTRERPDGFVIVRPRRWTLRERAIELRRFFGTRRYTRENVRAVVLAPAVRSESKTTYYASLELWLQTRWSWIRLARSAEVPGRQPAPTPTLESLAVEVARALDVPVRAAGSRGW